MALDTAQKRSSAIAISSPWRCRLPIPDGTIGQADRQQSAYAYSGILAGEAVSPSYETVYTTGYTWIDVQSSGYTWQEVRIER